MEKMDLAALELVLGIEEPWSLKSVSVDEINQTIDVYLVPKGKKKRFGFRDSTNFSEGMQRGSWAYMPIGNYRTIVHAMIPSSSNSAERAAINKVGLQLPAFLGHANRSYSNYVRQKVALNLMKGIPASVTQDALLLNETIYNIICDDLKSTAPELKQLTYLPTEVDPVWRQVLQNKLRIKTSHVAFKMLLSKQQLNAAKAEDSIVVRQSTSQLWAFFYANASQLEQELDQICGVNTKALKAKVNANRSKQKLVLPAIKNPVWIEILSGKVNLKSASVPLNLLISKQRIAFMKGKTNADKVHSIETLRAYVKLNYRSLKRELLLINQAMKTVRSQFQLPADEHQIWQRILEDDGFVPSHNMAYKLLLTKLRNQVSANRDPVVRIEAARNIRNFMRQNSKVLQAELKIIAQHSPA